MSSSSSGIAVFWFSVRLLISCWRLFIDLLYWASKSDWRRLRLVDLLQLALRMLALADVLGVMNSGCVVISSGCCDVTSSSSSMPPTASSHSSADYSRDPEIKGITDCWRVLLLFITCHHLQTLNFGNFKTYHDLIFLQDVGEWDLKTNLYLVWSTCTT